MSQFLWTPTNIFSTQFELTGATRISISPGRQLDWSAPAVMVLTGFLQWQPGVSRPTWGVSSLRRKPAISLSGTRSTSHRLPLVGLPVVITTLMSIVGSANGRFDFQLAGFRNQTQPLLGAVILIQDRD